MLHSILCQATAQNRKGTRLMTALEITSNEENLKLRGCLEWKTQGETEELWGRGMDLRALQHNSLKQSGKLHCKKMGVSLKP